MPNFTNEERAERCEKCLFAIPEFVPDPNSPYMAGKTKPRVPGFKCHIGRPGVTGGFPTVRGDEFCGFFTDAKTRKQPLARLITPLFATADGITFHTARGDEQ